MNRKEQSSLMGFTFVEIMVVVAIIALLSSIAIPSLLNARLTANESAAISGLKTVAAAAHTFRAGNTTYPANLNVLGSANPPYIDPVLGCAVQPCAKQGYNFTLAGNATAFTANAAPITLGTTGNRYFFVDTSGIVRVGNSSSGTPLD